MLIIALGGTARIPKVLALYAAYPRVTHTSTYNQRIAGGVKAAGSSGTLIICNGFGPVS